MTVALAAVIPKRLLALRMYPTYQRDFKTFRAWKGWIVPVMFAPPMTVTVPFVEQISETEKQPT